MGYWLATADADGNRISGSELLLQPGPSRVDYVQEPGGELVETTDGGLVHQQPSLDNRRRTWEWNNFDGNMSAYQRVWPVLDASRSRYRKESGLSPYVWLKEDVTGGLVRRQTWTGTVSAASNFSATMGSAPPAGVVGGALIVAGQVRAILGVGGTTITVGDAFSGSPSGDAVILYTAADWFRARILEVSRKTADGSMVRYEGSRIVFVIDDPNSRDLIG